MTPWQRLLAVSSASCRATKGSSLAKQSCAGPSIGSNQATTECRKDQMARMTLAQSTTQQYAQACTAATTSERSPLPRAVPTITVAALGVPRMSMKSQSEAEAAATCAASSGPSFRPPASRVSTSQAHQSQPYMAMLGSPNLAKATRPRQDRAACHGHHQPAQLGVGFDHEMYPARSKKETMAFVVQAAPKLCMTGRSSCCSRRAQHKSCTGKATASTTRLGVGNPWFSRNFLSVSYWKSNQMPGMHANTKFLASEAVWLSATPTTVSSGSVKQRSTAQPMAKTVIQIWHRWRCILAMAKSPLPKACGTSASWPPVQPARATKATQVSTVLPRPKAPTARSLSASSPAWQWLAAMRGMRKPQPSSA
mmetsp:Transcript_76263/g.177006  ORF Transcript_76263/g.177006 Transcript_76263/m.177006 type:complete len:366 (-) Transcript_76263:203-1300(-)